MAQGAWLSRRSIVEAWDKKHLGEAEASLKSEEEVSKRVRDLLVAELSARIKEAASKRPTSCKYNHRHPLDDRRTVEGDPNPVYNQIAPAAAVDRTLGLCMYGSSDPSEWSADICEDDVDALRCPYFDPARSEADVVAEFQVLIKDPLWLQTNLPGIAELRWVLDGQQEVATALGGDASMEASLEVHPTEVERITARVEAHLANTTLVPVKEVPLVLVIEAWFSRVWRAIWGK